MSPVAGRRIELLRVLRTSAQNIEYLAVPCQRSQRLVESSVGAQLANATAAGEIDLFYWRERNREVDFVVRRGRPLIAVEVKSRRVPQAHPGTAAFRDPSQPHGRRRRRRPRGLSRSSGVALDQSLSIGSPSWGRGLTYYSAMSLWDRPRL